VKGHLKLLAVLAAIVAATCAAPPPAFSQAPPPVHHIAMTRGAFQTLDSLATQARSTRTENAACLADYGVARDTLFLVRFIGASYAKADSVTISSTTPICPFGVPTIHSHVAYDGYPQPSQVDVETSVKVGLWGMILSVTDSAWRIIVY
jgi:hypothetical protein